MGFISDVVTFLMSLFKKKVCLPAETLQINLLSYPWGKLLEENIKMAVMTNTQKIRLAVMAKDAKGNPAQVKGVPTWVCSDPTKATIELPNPDGLSCVLVGKANGTVTVTVSVANLADKMLTSAPVTIEIVAGLAASLEIILSVPEEQ